MKVSISTANYPIKLNGSHRRTCLALCLQLNAYLRVCECVCDCVFVYACVCVFIFTFIIISAATLRRSVRKQEKAREINGCEVRGTMTDRQTAVGVGGGARWECRG